MTQEELKDYLKEHLSISVADTGNDYYSKKDIQLRLDNEVISSDTLEWKEYD